MKAVIVRKPGGVEELEIGEVSTPKPEGNEILVKVYAAALNRADIMQRQGKYPPPAGVSEILGLEIAGEVFSAGNKVEKWKKGDKIFGLVPGGGNAEFAVIDERMANPIPSNLSYEEAAAIPEVFLTAYQALYWHAKLKKGEKILIHAGGSGVGTAAIQMAKIIGSVIYITASKEKHSMCLNLGAKAAIDYKNENFEEKVTQLTEGKGVDVIIDFLAGPYFMQNLKSLTFDGRLIMLATLGGTKMENANIGSILSKRLTIIGSNLRGRTRDYQIKLNNEFYEYAYEKFRDGVLKPVIDKVFNWKDVAKAHLYMEANKNTGKIVLKIFD
ncbi:MAG TPA: NAD(P)H-quinone oxidoreductase [Ignavibacteriaceae bacterium]|nr:NAD(P)H-quinone oxidoreductase [Ignavibacteriaceae bacterium]